MSDGAVTLEFPENSANESMELKVEVKIPEWPKGERFKWMLLRVEPVNARFLKDGHLHFGKSVTITFDMEDFTSYIDPHLTHHIDETTQVYIPSTYDMENSYGHSYNCHSFCEGGQLPFTAHAE
jgi:hypothetical protein